MLKVPFYPNLADETHCMQASLKSVLKFYFPKRNYSFKYLDRVTAHKKGMATWDFAVLLFLARLGLEVIYIIDFDLKKFSKEGKKYVKNLWSKEVYEYQNTYSDISAEQKRAIKVFQEKRIRFLKRYATLRDLISLYAKGYVTIIPINPYILRREKGYVSHVVVATDVQKKTITIHDSGLPPIKNHMVSLSLFLKAMQDGAKESATIIAVRKK